MATKIDGGGNGDYGPQPPLPGAPETSRITIIVGATTTVFSITFLLLLYVKHCKRSSSDDSRGGGPVMLPRGNSGINRKVIESLPMFRFSSLSGHRDGLECAVCLNRFAADEVLRLLPKCRHAFHVECVDTWLDAHSTCPLCRYRVDPEDVLLLVDYGERRSSSGGGGALCNSGGEQSNITPRCSDHAKRNRRISGRHSSAGERRSSLEIIVENPGDRRISLDSLSSRRKTGKPAAENPGRKDGELPVKGEKHRVEHRIIISDGGGGAAEEEERGRPRRRWSDVEAAEFLYLRSEMVIAGDDGWSGKGVMNERSVSEITGMSRYRNSNGERGGGEREREERERNKKGWLDWVSQRTAVDSAIVAAASASSSSSSAIAV